MSDSAHKKTLEIKKLELLAMDSFGQIHMFYILIFSNRFKPQQIEGSNGEFGVIFLKIF